MVGYIGMLCIFLSTHAICFRKSIENVVVLRPASDIFFQRNCTDCFFSHHKTINWNVSVIFDATRRIIFLIYLIFQHVTHRLSDFFHFVSRRLQC